MKTDEVPRGSLTAAGEAPPAMGNEPSFARRRLRRVHRSVDGIQVEATDSQLVLLATVAAACVTVAAVLVLTAWAYATATGSTDLRSSAIDPVFEDRDQLLWLVALART